MGCSSLDLANDRRRMMLEKFNPRWGVPLGTGRSSVGAGFAVLHGRWMASSVEVWRR